MRRTYSLLAVMALGLVMGGGLLGDEPQQAPSPRIRGSLPQNWNKIGLTDVQKQKIYGIQAEYRGKIADLQKQITNLKKKQKEAMEKLLTDAQKTRLREIAVEKAPAVTKPKDDKKPAAKPAKPADKKP